MRRFGTGTEVGGPPPRGSGSEASSFTRFRPVAVARADTNEKAMLFVREGISPFSVEFFQDFIHSSFLGGLAGQPPQTALLRAPASPTLDRTLPRWADLGRPAFEAGI